MLISIVIIVLTSAPLYFLNENTSTNWLVFPLAGFQGIGLAIMLNTATSLISDVIGNDTANSAFVYGCYSLFDKFANGGLLYFILATYTHDPNAIKTIMAFVPIVCAVAAYVFTWIGNRYFSHKMAKITGVA